MGFSHITPPADTDTNLAIATGAEVDTGTNNTKAASPKAIADSGLLFNVSEDVTPTLGGDLDVADKKLTGAASIGFTQELDNGSKTTDFSVDFSTDQKQKCTLTANTITLTLDTTDVKVGSYLLKVVNGGLATLTWASETGSILWVGGAAPTLTSSGTDLVAFYFDGTNWHGQASLSFS